MFTNDGDLLILYKLYKNIVLHKPAKHPASSLKQEVDCPYMVEQLGTNSSLSFVNFI